MPHPRSVRSTTSFATCLWIACLSVAFWSTAAFAAPDPVGPDPVVKVTQYGAKIYWTPLVDHKGHTLTVSGPAGYHVESTYLPWKDGFLDTHGLRDGTYNWRNVLVPVVSGEVEEMMQDARDNDDEIEDLLLAEGLLVQQIASGSFRILDGELIVPDPNGPVEPEGLRPADTESSAESDHLGPVPFKNRLSPSLCVGSGCPFTSSFGFDTIRLRENNLRIHFDDTSSLFAFPRQDWRLIANDTANGGLSHFTIAADDQGDRHLFTIEDGARRDSLYVDDTGKVGLGTNSPARRLHISTGDTPTVRLDQDESYGFAPQVWDIAGNEQSFYVRDMTNQGSMPFRIRPGAPDEALVIDSRGYVGLGTLGPTSALHVRRPDAQVLVENTNSSASSGNARTLLRLENLGKLDFRLTDTSSGNTWKFENDPNGFFISLDGSGATEMALRNNGDLIIDGTLTESSDVARKERVEGVDPQEILASVLELPITTWSYVDDPASTRHIGPMAQDFYAAFGYGGTATGVQSRNLGSVALAAVQGLETKATSTEASLRADLEAKQQRIGELEQRLAALEAALRVRPVD